MSRLYRYVVYTVLPILLFSSLYGTRAGFSAAVTGFGIGAGFDVATQLHPAGRRLRLQGVLFAAICLAGAYLGGLRWGWLTVGIAYALALSLMIRLDGRAT